MAGAVGEQVTSTVDTQKNQLADRLKDVAQAVHRSGEQLESHQDWIAHLVEQGADELTSLASTLRSNDLQSLLGNFGALAKRQSALFVGALMAAGFALARVGRIAVAGSSEMSASEMGAPEGGISAMPASPASSAAATAISPTGASSERQ